MFLSFITIVIFMISYIMLHDTFLLILRFAIEIILSKLLVYNLCLIIDYVALLFSHVLWPIIVVTLILLSVIMIALFKNNSICYKVKSLSTSFMISILILIFIDYLTEFLTIFSFNCLLDSH